jgi:hypothetical protein
VFVETVAILRDAGSNQAAREHTIDLTRSLVVKCCSAGCASFLANALAA